MPEDPQIADALSPVTSDGEEELEDGTALCLSGGGYRAMLFHVGALWRLNELGHLPKLDRVSSVSGGSITAATLALGWSTLTFDAHDTATNLDDVLVAPLRRLADHTLDTWSVIAGLFTRGSAADRVADAYRKHLFGDSTLQHLPDHPRFVVNATSLQTGDLWRFSKPYMADYKVGMIRNPEVPLAEAVAASSAFPPFLAPLHLTVDEKSFVSRGELAEKPFTTDVVLGDGGIYDNLGLETAWKRCRTVLISDGGGQMQPEGEVPGDWIRESIRVGSVIDTQVRNLRKRQAIAGFIRGDRTGAYWGIRSTVAEFGPPPGSLPCPEKATARLATVPTRLAELDGTTPDRLINGGYAVTDVAMRRWVLPDAPPPEQFPYPTAGIG